MLSASERSLRARIAALSQHSQGRTNTGPARAAFDERFRTHVLQAAAEKGEELTEAEVQRRATAARKLHFARLSFASVRARTRAANARGAAEPSS